MQWTLAALALLAQHAAAQNMLRFACSQLVVDRVDPLVDPGMVYTPHLHQIVGGNSFNITMDPAVHDPAALSTCTSCTFKEDLSNYWTAVMFFKAKNGTYIRVPQTGNGGPQGSLVNKGGLDVYYIPSGKVTAFKPVSQPSKLYVLLPSHAVGFPNACWKCCQSRPKQGAIRIYLPSLLDLYERQHLRWRCTLHWQRYR